MERASITIKTKDGILWDANHIALHYRDGDLRPMISFLCSGRMRTIEAAMVEGIEFRADGTTWCDACEQILPGNVVQTKA